MVDGTRCGEGGINRKAEMDGKVRAEEKDFPAITEAHQWGIFYVLKEQVNVQKTRGKHGGNSQDGPTILKRNWKYCKKESMKGIKSK